jgi:thioredoxin-related protein
MIKIWIITLFICVTSSSFVHAGNKVELKWNKFDEGLALAKKNNKKILVDVYADWCKWCKKMDAEVFSSDTIAPYLQKNYILIKLNGESQEKLNYKDEKMTASAFAQGFGVTGFPTVIFLEPTGDAITKVSGFIDAQNFLPMITFFGDDHYKKMTWQEYFAKYGPKPKVSE